MYTHLAELDSAALVHIDGLEIMRNRLGRDSFVRLRGRESSTGHFEFIHAELLFTFFMSMLPLIGVLEMHPENAQHEQMHKKFFEFIHVVHFVRQVVILWWISRQTVGDFENRFIRHNNLPG